VVVVLLRALKKASPFLYHYEMKTGDILRRLSDTAILTSCHGVFTAFDGNLMFREKESSTRLRGWSDSCIRGSGGGRRAGAGTR
jgi:hypothetical protein